MGRFSYLLFFFISRLFHLSMAQGERTFNPDCESFSCGKFQHITFPFTNRTHPECGFCMLDDCDKRIQKIQLEKDGTLYNITSISQDETATISDQVFQNHLDNRSCESFRNLTLPSTPLISFEILSNLTLFKCPLTLDSRISTNFNLSCDDFIIFYNHPKENLPSLPPKCSVIQLPGNLPSPNASDLFNLLTGVFSVKLHPDWVARRECRACRRRGGRCLIDNKGYLRCSNKITAGNKNMKLKLALGLGTSSVGICILIILAYSFREKLCSANSIIFWKKTAKKYQNIEAFLRDCGSLSRKRYTYSDIKKMTNSFKHKLGRGGYGRVYKGELLDGRSIAVKVLNESKGHGEDFINEVASISRTSHVNIVNLLGFCFEGRRRGLIYEFVPNGSLEKLICEKNPLETSHKLNWETLYKIALGIARGLEYLHRGCNTRILHFDIKPHNILLHEDFRPKIFDFGLAKICPSKESVVSITGARGTVGYRAPEVFCRNFGEVSHKSDVYSYGMMMFEMTAGRKNHDVEVNDSSDLYFPRWIYKCLETDEELVLQGIENEKDKEYARKMIIVSLWCMQAIPSNRPTISRVVEMLEGSLESLQVPPFLSPPGSSAGSSTLQA